MSRHAIFLGSEDSVFVSRTIEALTARGVEVTLIDPGSVQKTKPSKGYVAALKTLLLQLKFVYREMRACDPNSTVIVHSLTIKNALYILLLKRYFKRVAGLAYGSDILRRQKSRDPILGFCLKRLDALLATNAHVIQEIAESFPKLKQDLMGVIRFGLPVFDELDRLENTSPAAAKLALGFPPEKTLVALGYAASAGQRQSDLIDLFQTRIGDFSHCHFVVPVQYGDEQIQTRIIEKVTEINSPAGEKQFTALTDFHDPERAALMRRACDVLINHSVSDAFSGTVQETIYAGNLVLACDHLPYRTMPGYGDAIRSYSDTEHLCELLRTAALNPKDQAARHPSDNVRETLRQTSSWDHVAKTWYALIDGTWPKGITESKA